VWCLQSRRPEDARAERAVNSLGLM
jgi:hypothetical protein